MLRDRSDQRCERSEHRKQGNVAKRDYQKSKSVEKYTVSRLWKIHYSQSASSSTNISADPMQLQSNLQKKEILQKLASWFWNLHWDKMELKLPNNFGIKEEDWKLIAWCQSLIITLSNQWMASHRCNASSVYKYVFGYSHSARGSLRFGEMCS